MLTSGFMSQTADYYIKQTKVISAVHGRRLRKLDEANGQVAHNETHLDEQTDNGLMTERTGQVHHGTKQDIVRQWLEGAEEAPPTGAFAHCTCVLCTHRPPGHRTRVWLYDFTCIN